MQLGVAHSSRVAPDFWRGRRVMLTGHTGFKGSWLTIWLKRMGAQLAGVALPPVTKPNLFTEAGTERHLDHSMTLDICDLPALVGFVSEVQPEIVIHLAAQPLVRRGYLKPVETFQSNVMGTVNLLEALRVVGGPRVVVMVTTDKVYANTESVWPYRENDVLGGDDPYSASKAASEIVIDCYRKAFLTEQNVTVASARAGNVMGGGDWSEDRLLPDAVRAWRAGATLKVRRPEAVRPWQHVLEPLAGYLILAQALWSGRALPTAYNLGPTPSEAAPVREVIQTAAALWGPTARVSWGGGSQGPHETELLSLETSRARANLGIVPRWGIHESIARTIFWYQAHLSGEDATRLCHRDISEYENQV